MKKCAKKAAGGEVKKEAEEKKDAFKRGGKVGKKIGGKKPHGRPDKKSRGGKADMQSTPGVKGGVSASSPLSGAGKTAEPKNAKNDKEDD